MRLENPRKDDLQRIRADRHKLVVRNFAEQRADHSKSFFHNYKFEQGGKMLIQFKWNFEYNCLEILRVLF